MTEWDVTNVLLNGDCDPYPVVAPYFTCVLDVWSVVQVIVADVDVIPVDVTALITGPGAVVVAKVKFVEVVVKPDPLVDTTA